MGLDFNVTTHVWVDPDRPDEWNSIFQEMMSKPVEVISPELGGRFNAIVVIKPEHEKLDALKLTISIKEVPDSQSLIPGEEFTIPASRIVEEKGESTENATKGTSTSAISDLISKYANDRGMSKINSILKKNKGSE